MSDGRQSGVNLERASTLIQASGLITRKMPSRVPVRAPSKRREANQLFLPGMSWVAAVVLAQLGNLALAADLLVGPGMPWTTPSAAAQAALDGDLLMIEAGTYQGDVPTWAQNDLTLRAVGGEVRLLADGHSAGGKGIWVIKGDRVTVEGISFEGARVSDGNGAGIRAEGRDLTVSHCRFEGNQNGILASKQPESDVLIEHSVFIRNGAGDGKTHNLYIGNVRSLTFRHNRSSGARVGHQLKSRARENRIFYNELTDGKEGNSSYIVDLPDAGAAFIVGNLIQQGPRAENATLVSYAAESTSNGNGPLYIVNNTFINDREAGATFVRNRSNSKHVVLINNILAGKGKPLVGDGRMINNVISRDAGLEAPDLGDFSLRSDSEAIDKGIDPGRAEDGTELRPLWEPGPGGKTRQDRSGALDVGAYEFVGEDAR
jgi:hypothetical protein